MGKRPYLSAAALLFLLIFLYNTAPVYGGQFICPPNSLRVALGLDLSSAQFAVSEGKYELVDYVTQMVLSTAPENGAWLVAPAGSTKLQVSNNGQSLPGLSGDMLILRQKNSSEQNIFQFKNKRYRGDLLIENINGKLQLINVIDVEQYLYGVVGAEMGNGAPEEAYKAQAAVSRSYALYYKENPQLYYDVGTTTAYQVYGGYDEEESSDSFVKKAVDATQGQVIYYDNNLIQAFFHSNSGGYTESSENVWYYDLPYLEPVSAPEDNYVLQMTQYNGWPGNTYQWQKTFTRQELTERIKKWNADHPDSAVNVGEIRQIMAGRYAIDPDTREYLSAETLSKRVTQLDFVGTTGVKSFFRDTIRSVLNLKSTLFELTLDSTVKIRTALESLQTFQDTQNVLAINVDGLTGKLNGNNSEYYVLTADGVKTIPKVFKNLVIDGKGYGHGLGMSQWGAWGMAVRGGNYRTIIEHYYNQDKNDGRLVIKRYST